MSKDQEIADFIRRSRGVGVTDTALALQLDLTHRTFSRRVAELRAAGLDCGKPRGVGAPRKKLVLPQTEPAGDK